MFQLALLVTIALLAIETYAVTPVPAVNASAYLGRWYQVRYSCVLTNASSPRAQMYEDPFEADTFEAFAFCSVADYGQVSDGSCILIKCHIIEFTVLTT